MPQITMSTPADVPELNILINSAYRGESSKKGWTSEAHLLDGLRIDEATLNQYLGDARVTILKYTDDSNKIQACVYLQAEAGKLYIGMLTVNPELQNSGIGRQLLEVAEQHARTANCHTLWMTVIDSRHELLAYYQRKGFIKTGEEEPFPTDPVFGIQKEPFVLLVLEKVIN